MLPSLLKTQPMKNILPGSGTLNPIFHYLIGLAQIFFHCHHTSKFISKKGTQKHWTYLSYHLLKLPQPNSGGNLLSFSSRRLQIQKHWLWEWDTHPKVPVAEKQKMTIVFCILFGHNWGLRKTMVVAQLSLEDYDAEPQFIMFYSSNKINSYKSTGIADNFILPALHCRCFPAPSQFFPDTP